MTKAIDGKLLSAEIKCKGFWRLQMKYKKYNWENNYQ